MSPSAPRLRFETLEQRNLLTVNFDIVGEFAGLEGQAKVLNNPTSLDFGPDGRLYVAEQNGDINAFTVTDQNGNYVVTAHEELLLPTGGGVVKSIQNHDDFGTPVTDENRQVTGLIVTGTETEPVIYISSSDPRISFSGDSGLDTNSGVITRVALVSGEWTATDIVRGLPRSEENHSVNGLELSADGTKLYVQVGGNTNNGAPSQFFSNTAEYALSAALLEIDLVQIDQLPVQVDFGGGQNGVARNYVYDLPTLDDPSVPNDGVRETVDGLDVAGPWGGNDGFNMAILSSDAPLRIYADGLRNPFDVVLTQAGHFYSIDNGSNNNLGADPIIDEFGEATQLPTTGGVGNPEPLFRIEAGEYYGHPNPARANQDLAWTVYDDTGVADVGVTPNFVSDLSTLVPAGLVGTLPAGMIIDPSKFTGDPVRLAESGVRIPSDDPASNSIVNLGTSTNGITEYTGDAFDGALQGALVTAQFNGNITLLNLNATGDGIEPLIGPGGDMMLGTADDEVIDADGIFPLATGQSLPLDVTMGPNGTIWFAEFGPDNIKVLAPTDLVLPDDPDFDNDGLLNTVDPFLRDATNGGQLILPGETYLWDFDANQDDNLPGPSGYGGGLTGVMVDGVTDFEQFFQAESTIPGQIINLDNVKFTTAAGGGTTVVEFVSNGDASASQNDGEYLFHTGVTIAPSVETFNVRWSFFNPGDAFVGETQQIGGYLGTGEQGNFLKIVAAKDPHGEILVALEDQDVATNTYLQADDLFDVLESDAKRIFIDLEVDPDAETATPTITYETETDQAVVVGSPISLSGSNVLDAIRRDYQTEGQTTGLAVGLYSSNVGQLEDDTFQAIFDAIEIDATGTFPTTLYRVNAGGPEVLATDDGPNWLEDTESSPSIFLENVGENRASQYPTVIAGPTVPAGIPVEIFTTERDDNVVVPNMAWAFEAPVAASYEVRLFLANGNESTDGPGDRLFDVAIEGQVLPSLDNIDLSGQFGHQVGGMISNVVEVTDGVLNLEFIHDKKRPLVNGIEVILLPNLPPGAAELAVTVDVDAVQKSSFGADSFVITNTGGKRISRVDLDISTALFPDIVFDPFGVAGDSTSKPLRIDTPGETGVVDPNTYEPYEGMGGTAGFNRVSLLFDTAVDDGFEPGETLGFSIDVDSSSIAGSDKATLDLGANPAWDVGGVSGAELIGSTFTVTFVDGSMAIGQLQGAANQAGSQGIADETSPNLMANLSVNGLLPGEVGTYATGGPTVVVEGPAGETARVVLSKGIVQPIDNLFEEPQATLLDSQLAILAATEFPANNATEFQTVDILLDGTPQDITSHFDFTHVPVFELPVDEDQVPLAFVASVIDTTNGNLPLGSVSAPIYLQHSQTSNVFPSAVDDAFTVNSQAVLTGNLLADNGLGSDFDVDVADSIHVSAVNGIFALNALLTLRSGATLEVHADGSFTYDPNRAFDHLTNGELAIDRFHYTLTDGKDENGALVTITIVGVQPASQTRLLVVDDQADEQFSYDTQATLISSHPLDHANGSARGLAAAQDGSAVWVVDQNRSVYVYDSAGLLLHQWEFTGFSTPEGIAVSGDDLWIVSRQTDEVYYFAGGANLTSGSHAATSSFALDASNSSPYGITTDGVSLWVVNDASNAWKTFQYSLSGALLGSWDLDSGNRNARGITIDPENPADLLVVNSGNQDVVFRYRDGRTTTSGSLSADSTQTLASANSVPSGLAVVAPIEAPSADFDSDGDVDGSDFLLWQLGFGVGAGIAAKGDGDANNDRDVDAQDLIVWRDQYAQAISPAVSSGLQALTTLESLNSAQLLDAALAFWEDSRQDPDEALVQGRRPLHTPEALRTSEFAPQPRNSYSSLSQPSPVDEDASEEPTDDHSDAWIADLLVEELFGESR